MGLGKIIRGGGKLALALQVVLTIWDAGAAIGARFRRRSAKPPTDSTAEIEQPQPDPGQRTDADHNHLQR